MLHRKSFASSTVATCVRGLMKLNKMYESASHHEKNASSFKFGKLGFVTNLKCSYYMSPSAA